MTRIQRTTSNSLRDMGPWLLGVLAFMVLFGAGVGLQAGTVLGAAFEEQEYFDTSNTVNDWTNWQPTDVNGNPNGSPGSNGWLMTRNTNTGTNGTTLTPSAGTGPTSVHSGGASGGFLFLENSGSPPYPDRYFTRKTALDASKHNLSVSFAYSLYGAGMGTLELQVNDGSGWTTEWKQVGNDGQSGAWTTKTIDLYGGTGLSGKRYYGNSVRLRFRFISGSTFEGDAAIDTVRIFGPEACIETATVALGSIPSPISAPVTISASLGGTGGTNPQVSFDGTNWLANGSTYTPPASSTGTQKFYARATGFCATYIYDPFNPTSVAYDTTCSDATPSTISIPVGQVVTGSVDLTTLFSKTGNVGSFTYKINGNAVSSPWNSAAYGLTATEAITFEVTGTDPDCGGNTLVKSGYITVDNTCIEKAPTFGFDRTFKYADAGTTAVYTVTVYNNDEGTCTSDNFTLSVMSDSDPVRFTGTITGANPLTIAPGGAASSTVSVAVAAGSAEWLENSTTVRVDAASHADPADSTVKTIVHKEVPLLHNSITTDSTKHGGKWGTSQPGAKYGKLTCVTCHQRNTTNIKRVRTTLPTAPDGTTFPGSGGTVTFLDARDGSSDLGDDGRVDKTTSNYICEMCHTYDATQTAGVNKHAYDMSTAASTTHYNKKDCTSCHDHQNGFRAGCTACHGDEATNISWADGTPDAFPDRLGAHTAHVEQLGNYLASGNKDNMALTTVEHKNSTCSYCHPDAGGSNADGGSHMDNTAGSPSNIADLHGDGYNGSYFKTFAGADDIDGTYNPSLKRCSNIDCHSNGKFTWAWYGDAIAPAAVTNLAAATGSEVGTVALSWTAPGNDGNTAGKAYRYEVRYSTTAIGDETAWNAATVAGSPPTANWPGSVQSMTVQGLAPGTTYHFAIKTGDEAGNWSPLSSPNPSAVAKADTEAPIFRGVETAAPVFTSGNVTLGWPEASDRSKPIDYLIWWRTSDQVIDYTQPPNATTTGLTYLVAGLTDGTNYNFAVRARDAFGNIDTNAVQKEAIPQSPPEKDWIGKTYYARQLNSATCDSTLNYAGSLMTGGLYDSYSCGVDTRNRVENITANADIARWTAASAYTQATNITGGYFRIYVQERSENTDQTVTIKLGYADNTSGTNFQLLGSASKIIKREFRGSVSFSLNSITGQIPATKHLVVYFTKTVGGSADLRFRYASERYRSELTVYEQVANARPNAFTVNTPAPGTPAGAFDISWAAAVDPDGDPVAYNVYGELSDGTRYVIAEKTSQTTAAWDSVKDGVGLSAAATGVVIRVQATDGMTHKEGASYFDHREAVSGIFTINNTSDIIAPAAVVDMVAEHRPKNGSVYLYWSAPGDDGLVGRASQYDIRYSTAEITAANFGTATEVSGEPVPGEPGLRQGYEVLGLSAGQTYYFALKTADETPNWSGLSNVPSQKGGPACGVCHSTPPDETGRAGMHEQHGYTQVDCAKCHGFEAINFQNNHSDGANKLVYNNPKKGFNNTAYPAVTETDTRVTFHAGGTAFGTVIYDDTDGGGGYNDLGPLGDNSDTGSCFGFNATGVTGCHGSAGSDPDGAGPLPTYPAPKWADATSVSCAMCHGDPNRADTTPFGRPFEDGTRDGKYAGSEKIFRAAPGIDLKGNSSSNAVGQHLVHLNFSYRFTGHSCTLCHLGSEHVDGTVDVLMDKSVAGVNAQWNRNAGGPGTPGTCSGTNQIRCHGNGTSDPEWKVRSTPTAKLVECNECHGFAGKTYTVGNPGSSQIPHVSDLGQVRHCTWCHVEGHPREGFSVSAATKANPVQLTSAKHGLQTGDTVVVHIEGMTELNHRFATVTVVDADKFTMDGIDSTSYGTFSAGHWKRAYPARTVTGITKANPASVTSAGHGLATGATVLLNVSGMTELYGYSGPITVVNADTFTLDGVNSSAYGTFTSGSWIHDDGAILVPNYSIAGIDYSSGGIHLKRVVNGRSTLNNGELIATEAETCWGCHEDQSPVISEWGTNTKALTGSMSYNYGTLNQSSWVGAIWSSATFSYKDGTIQSTHSVNPAVLAPGLDTDDQIRCSYCHDVHDMNQAIGDSSSGTPYLRGSWKGNPYKEDGAPGRNNRGTGTFTGALSYYPLQRDFGGVPRGTPSTTQMGGYWIDQNSGYPTASWTLGNSAGLCTLCHGTDVNNMNKFGATSDAWIGTNGHSNAVIGGSGVHKYNVYDPLLRNEGTTWDDPSMGYQDVTGPDTGNTARMFGVRNNNEGSDTTATTGDGIYPYAWSTTQNKNIYAYEEFNWGLDRATGAANADYGYHRFSCSKCHNPHASRLPRLMITNCLDITHNTWDNLMIGQSDWTTGKANGTTVNWTNKGVMPYNGTDLAGNLIDKQIAYATSAQNCHRFVESGKSISGITKANPAVVTSTAHGLTTGNNIKLKVAGMTQLEGWQGTITVLTADTFSLDGVNSTSYGTFSSGRWWGKVEEQGWNKITPWRP